jgi:hypothetical protein
MNSRLDEQSFILVWLNICSWLKCVRQATVVAALRENKRRRANNSVTQRRVDRRYSQDQVGRALKQLGVEHIPAYSREARR